MGSLKPNSAGLFLSKLWVVFHESFNIIDWTAFVGYIIKIMLLLG